jgi:hypothetical protein
MEKTHQLPPIVGRQARLDAKFSIESAGVHGVRNRRKKEDHVKS